MSYLTNEEIIRDLNAGRLSLDKAQRYLRQNAIRRGIDSSIYTRTRKPVSSQRGFHQSGCHAAPTRG